VGGVSAGADDSGDPRHHLLDGGLPLDVPAEADPERCIVYDLVEDGDQWRPATSYQTAVDDTIDLTLGSALPDAIAVPRCSPRSCNR